MPGIWKKIVFSFASVLCITSIILIVVALSTEKWVTGKILCKTGVDLVNASDPELVKFIGDIYFGLFQGGKIRKCGLGSRRSKIYSLFGVFAIVCFIAAMKRHRLTERVANFKEDIFQFVVLEEDYAFSFWLCVASAATHAANFIVVAMSMIRLPKMQTKKPEEPVVTVEDLLY
ncbi:hypothetical protein AGOR_G00189130 [Albula goreensis]|uniref:Clarin-2 n=1 Tax=Albula goreensis TaxID=1534307 RepID=A0A8T3CQF4_9TELE|nr:hypothetical protein AGOR_G00189130 [Albula goreensis]